MQTKGRRANKRGKKIASELAEYNVGEFDHMNELHNADKRRLVARYEGFHTDGVAEIVSYDDGCEVYRYYDNIEIVCCPFSATRIRGKFLTVKEWKDELVYTFEDEFGALQQLASRHESDEYDVVINKIWEREKDLAVQMRYGLQNQDEANGLQKEIELLHLEERAVTARRSIVDELFRYHFAAKSCEELFTFHGTTRRKPKSARSPTQNIISLAEAIGRIAAEHEKQRFKGERIELCRDLLSKCRIRGKPGYTPTELNNNVSQLNAKTGRNTNRKAK